MPYVLGFEVLDCRSLQLEDGETKIDAFLTIECCDKKHKSPTKEGETPKLINWDFQHIWPDLDMSEDEFNTAYVEFKIFARHWFTRNYEVGRTSLQLKTINNRQRYMYYKKVMPLLKDGDPTPTGMITLSVFCVGPGQQAPNMSAAVVDQDDDDVAQEDDLDDLGKAVCKDAVDVANLGSPHHVRIDILKVKNLVKDSSGFFPSPMVTVEFNSSCVKVDGTKNEEKFDFRTTVMIPVIAPVFEDSILVKLWSSNWTGPDELLAQGNLSFIELRNNPLQPARWFNLYGWDSNEITESQLKQITASTGEHIKPNYYKGSLLISGRVERLDSFEDLKQATCFPAKTCIEPQQVQRTLLGDVYEVSGAIGREAIVEIKCANMAAETKWVKADWTQKGDDVHNSSVEDEEDDPDADYEDLANFKFSQEEGRLDPLLLMVPEDRESRPDVMINIYTRGVLSAKQRVGYQVKKIQDIGSFEPGNPAKPRFVQLEPMPYNIKQTSPASILIVLEQTTRVPPKVKHNRKDVKPMQYCVRAYIFMARNIDAEHPQDFRVRVHCAGVGKTTKATRGEVRPNFMQMLDLPVWFCSDHAQEPPTVEPITVTLEQGSGPLAIDHSKASCFYEYMRQRDSMKNWEPFELNPQWIQLFGGQYASKPKAELLVAFEMLLAKDWNQESKEPDLEPKSMWPVDDDSKEERPFSRNKRCTLHFSLLGLRDIVFPKNNALTQIGNTVGAVYDDKLFPEPEVLVQVKKMHQPDKDSKASDSDKYYTMKFNFSEEPEKGGNKPQQPMPKKNKWTTTNTAGVTCQNFEMFQVKKMNIMLPDRFILEPFITIKVCATVKGLSDTFGLSKPLIGEHRRGLTQLIPCSWYGSEGTIINPIATYKDQEDTIEKEKETACAQQEAKPKFQEATKEERQKLAARYRERERKEELEKTGSKAAQKAKLKDDDEIDKISSAGIPRELEVRNPITNPNGTPSGTKQKLPVSLDDDMWVHLNVTKGTFFSALDGEALKKKETDGMAPLLRGKMESKKKFPDGDFHFKGQPLLKNHDIIDPDDDTHDWYFEHNACFGFVKCLFKLTDGWEEEEQVHHEDSKKEGQLAFMDNLLPEKLRGMFGGNKAPAPASNLEKEDSSTMSKTHKLSLLENEGSPEPEQESKGSIIKEDVSTEAKLKKIQQKLEEIRGREHVGSQEVANRGFRADKEEMIAELEKIKKYINYTKSVWDRKKGGDEKGKEGNGLDAKKKSVASLASSDKLAVPEEVARGSINQTVAAGVGEKETGVEAVLGELTWAMVVKASLRKELQDCKEWLDDHKDSTDKPPRPLIIEMLEKFNDMEKLATTYGYDISLSTWAFDAKRVMDKYRAVPARIRVRIYFTKAICVSEIANPYIKYTIGTPTGEEEEVSLRNQPEYNDNTPQFYRTEERDIKLPDGGKLMISIMDLKEDFTLGDKEIGGTVIDLEDRWHSDVCKDFWNRMAIPREDRPLYKALVPSKEMSGSLEMFVEMIETTNAGDRKAIVLAKPPPSMVEVRFVIWKCEEVKPQPKGSTDAMVATRLNCPSWEGEDRVFKKDQQTDIHCGCTGTATFNWRVVFPKIVLPTSACYVVIDLYQSSLLGGDHVMGSTSIDIRRYVEKVGATLDAIEIKQQRLPITSVLEEDDGPACILVFDMYVYTHAEATQKKAGVAQEEPNEYPLLIKPTEGRSWGDVLAAVSFSLPEMGFYKKVLPVMFIGIIFTILCLVALKQTGLL